MRLLSLAVGVGLLAGCSDSTAPPTRSLFLAKALWAQRGFHDYSYTSQSSCFCVNVNPIRVIVAADTVQSALDLKTNAAVNRAFVSTIDEVFASIERTLSGHDPVDATFDARVGYPIDVTFNAPDIPSDGGGYLSIRDFRVGVP